MICCSESLERRFSWRFSDSTGFDNTRVQRKETARKGQTQAMRESGVLATIARIVGGLLLVLAVAALAIRLQQSGPYAFPDGGPLVGVVLLLVVGGWLVFARAVAAPLTWLALVASPLVLFYGLYITLAELEEVIVLRVADDAGQTTDLRLWIADRDGVPWVTMPRWKADAYGLSGKRAELLRGGDLRCVVAVRHDDRPAVHAIHQLRQEKYAVQRLATTIGLYGPVPGDTTVALRLDPCPPGS
jgi:hypothetical protein